MIYLKTHCALFSVIYNTVYFAVPCQVEDTTLTTSSHSISVDWKKPTLIAIVLHIMSYTGCTL